MSTDNAISCTLYSNVKVPKYWQQSGNSTAVLVHLYTVYVLSLSHAGVLAASLVYFV